MNLLKKTALILVLTMLISLCPAMAADNLLINEVFENYALNETAFSSFNVHSGVDVRVTEDNGNKALYGKAWGSGVSVSVPLNGVDAKGKYVYSVRIKTTDEKPIGKLFSITDTSGNILDLITIKKDGGLYLPDNKQIGGYIHNKWTEYTVTADWRAQSISVYIDGKNAVYSWRLPKQTFGAAEKIDFSFAEPAEGIIQCLFDNLRIYKGNILPDKMKFPSVAYSSEVKEFTPATEIINEYTSYFDINFSSISGNIALGDHGLSVSYEKLEDENGVMKFETHSDSPCSGYFDIDSRSLSSDSRYVVQVDVFVKEFDGDGNRMELFYSKDANNNFYSGLYLKPDGTVYYARTNTKAGTFEFNEWTNFAIVYNKDAGLCDIYINEELALKDATCVSSMKPIIYRFDAKNNSGGNIDICLDNLRLYHSRTLLTNDETEENVNTPSVPSGERQTIYTDDKALEYSEDASVLMLTNNTLLVDGKKLSCDSNDLKPQVINGSTMIPAGAVELIGKTEVKWNKDSGEITVNGSSLKEDETTVNKNGTVSHLSSTPKEENGILYLPLRSVCENVLNKSVLWDERGFIVVSDSEFEYTNSPLFTETSEPIDEIYRFMQFDRPSGEAVIETIKKNFPNKAHPRIILDKTELDYIKNKVSTDSEWKKRINDWVVSTEPFMNKEIATNPDPLEIYDTYGNLYMNMMLKVGTAFLLTGDERYAEKGVKETLNACKWNNLGESYSALQSGHWAIGMAVAYDSFYNYLSQTDEGQETLAEMRKGINRLLYRINIRGFEGAEKSQWLGRNNNWLGVVGGGILALLLSVGDEEDLPDTAYMIENTLKALEKFIGFYSPDGGYFEGVSYSHYGAHLTVYALVALNRICKTDYGISTASGFKDMAKFFVYTQTPTGHFNFHDDSQQFLSNYIPYQICYLYDDPETLYYYDNLRSISGMKNDVLMQLYYEKCITNRNITVQPNKSLDNYFVGCDVGSFRNSFQTNTPVFAAYHGGYSGLNHDMLDLGQFYFEADGVIWAYDLGKDSYSLPNYFTPAGYAHYRKGTSGENCIVINPRKDSNKYFGQKVGAYAKLIDSESKARGAKAAYDLTEAYERDAESYIRGYYFGDNRNTLTVRDEITFKSSENEVYWFMHTPASIEITGENKAMLTSATGKKLQVDILVEGADEYELLDMEAKPFSFAPNASGQAGNNGIRKLAIRALSDKELSITVKLSPVNNEYDLTEISAEKISGWTIPDGEIPKKLELYELTVNGESVPAFNPTRNYYEIELPFGTEASPVVQAKSYDGEVVVTQAPTPFDEAKITVNKSGKRDSVYTVKFNVSSDREIVVTEELYDVQPVAKMSGTLISPVSASASDLSEPQNGPDKMIDNDLSTRCAVSGNGIWMEIDLGAVKEFDGVALGFFKGDTRNCYFDIMYSEDGINFKKVFNGESTGETAELESLPIPGKARYIRYVGYGNSYIPSAVWNSVTEFAVYKN